LTAPDLTAAVRPVLDALCDLGVRHYVGGSIASSAHGVARASIDADVVAELRPEHADRLCSAIVGAYYVPEARVREGIARKTSFNVIHLETMLKVDVFVSKGRPFDRRAMERARAAAPQTSDEGPLPLGGRGLRGPVRARSSPSPSGRPSATVTRSSQAPGGMRSRETMPSRIDRPAAGTSSAGAEKTVVSPWRSSIDARRASRPAAGVATRKRGSGVPPLADTVAAALHGAIDDGAIPVRIP
jgi:hypothetical protein